jgi:DNA adenine methylase
MWAFWYAANFSHSNQIGGGLKYSNDMHTNVPKTLNRRKQEFTETILERLENAYIENKDALEVLETRNVEDAFHYLDPPYVGADQGHYIGYTEQDLMMLLIWCADHCKGKFMISHFNHPLIDDMIEHNGWVKYEVQQVANAANRKHVPNTRTKVEILVMNYDIQPKLF